MIALALVSVDNYTLFLVLMVVEGNHAVLCPFVDRETRAVANQRIQALHILLINLFRDSPAEISPDATSYPDSQIPSAAPPFVIREYRKLRRE